MFFLFLPVKARPPVHDIVTFPRKSTFYISVIMFEISLVLLNSSRDHGIAVIYPKDRNHCYHISCLVVIFTLQVDRWTLCCCPHMSFDVKLFLLPLCCLLCHLVSDPAQTPPVGTKWHLVCRDAKDELDIMSRPGLPPMAQHCAPPRLVSSGRACSETERADLILPAGRIMRNSGISSGSPSHLH